MALSYEITTSGIKFNDAVDVISRVKEAFKIAFPDLDVEQSSSPQGQLINALSEEIITIRNDISELISAMYLGGNGVFLDIWANTFFSIHRQEATSMIASVKVTGQPNITIPNNFKAQTNDNKFTFVNISSDVTIPNEGFINIQMQSIETGSNQIISNSLTKILTPVIGIETITNVNNSSVGNNVETDSSLRQRCIDSFANRAVATFDSVISNVRNVRNVSKCVGFENDTGSPKTYKGISFPAHSISLYVLGGEVSDIGDAILKTKAPGCYTNGNIIVQYQFANSALLYDIRFNRPLEVLFGFIITISVTEFVEYNYTTTLEDTLLEYFTTKQNIGSDVIPANITNGLTLPKDVVLIKFETYKQSDGESAKTIDPVILNYNELGITNKTLIQVIVNE